MNSELKTPAEREREQRNQEIRNSYHLMVMEFPEVKNWRIYRSLAEKFGLSVMQIRNIVRAV